MLEDVARLVRRSRQLEAHADAADSTATVKAFVTRLHRSETSMPSAER
jgi:hypothetical protein